MKLKPVKLAPALIAVGVILLTCLLRLLIAADSNKASRTGPSRHFNFFERLERTTYDLRTRIALPFSSNAATNLGFAFMSDDSIRVVNSGWLGYYRYGLYWPRQIYGKAYHELAAQGARAVGFDILYREQRADQGSVPVPNRRSPDIVDFLAALHPNEPPIILTNDAKEVLTYVDSDDYFAWQLKRGGTAILAAEKKALPLDLFATNALAVADVTAARDADGVLRRAKAFQYYHQWWHPAFLQVEADPGFGVDLRDAEVQPGRIILHRSDGEEPIIVPVDAQTNFDLVDFGFKNLPPGAPRKARAVIEEQVWHMGIVLAARALDLNLDNAVVDLPHGRITLRGTNGVTRVIPVDSQGNFYINWQLTVTSPNLMVEPIESLLAQFHIRNGDLAGELTNRWANKLVVIGSSATGNDLTDHGATPLESDTLLVSEHWNIANSIITNRFVRRSSLVIDLLLIIAMGIGTALLTWQLRPIPSFCAVAILLAGYAALSVLLFVQQLYWLPVVLPLFVTVPIQYLCLATWRVVFEQAEQRRVKSIFSTVVSPKIMVELLKAEKLSLGGARREVTVMFADVRGFTEFTDKSQERAAAQVTAQKLSGAAAEACYDEIARVTLATVNLYLGLVADTIIQHDATLDKFIGDCVMAFWGAPAANPRHALACVRAAIEAQRTIHNLNEQRALENQRREQENAGRVSAGLEPLPLLPLLLLGSGINSGTVTVGLMGSETKSGVRQGNYTVFGREVNLASRLEGLSGRGRIFISETTYEQLRRDDPALAAACVLQPPAKLKGIGDAGKVFEVPWQTAGAPASANAERSTPNVQPSTGPDHP